MPAISTLAGLPVIDLRLLLPRVGVWSADVSVDSSTPLRGRVELRVGASTFVGSIRRGGVDSEVGVYRIAGGAGGLAKTASPMAYRQPTVNLILQDLLAGAGETLSPMSDPGMLGLTLDAWTTVARPTGVVLASLLEHIPGATSRVLPDGTVWVGRESYPLTRADPFVSIVNKRQDAVSVRFGHEGQLLAPGTTWLDRRVSYVEVIMLQDRGGTLDGEVWFE